MNTSPTTQTVALSPCKLRCYVNYILSYSKIFLRSDRVLRQRTQCLCGSKPHNAAWGVSRINPLISIATECPPQQACSNEISVVCVFDVSSSHDMHLTVSLGGETRTHHTYLRENWLACEIMGTSQLQLYQTAKLLQRNTPFSKLVWCFLMSCRFLSAFSGGSNRFGTFVKFFF